METILTAEQIRSFHPGVGPVSLTLHPRERRYFQGKAQECTVLFEMLTGLKRPDDGTVTILGQDVYTLEEGERAAFRRDHLGAISREGGFLKELTLLEQMEMPMNLAGFSREEMAQRIRKNVFSYLPLHALFNQAGRCSPRTLALAGLLRALVMEPQVLIFNAAFDHFSGADSRLVWQEMQMVLRENMALLYLSPDPRPEQFPK